MTASHSRITPLQCTLFVPLTPFKIDCQKGLVSLLPELLDRFWLARPDAGLEGRKDGCRECGMYLLVGSIVRDVTEVAVKGLKGSYLKNVWRLDQCLSESGSPVKTNQKTEQDDTPRFDHLQESTDGV